MDQGVIRLLKAKYHKKKIIQRLIRTVEMKKTLPKTTILDAMQLLTSAWSEVSEATIKNCFRKADKLAEEAINNQDDPFKNLSAEELEETINGFRERVPDEVAEDLNAAVLLDIDAELSTREDKPSDPEIFAKVQGEAIQEQEKEDDDIDVVYAEPLAKVEEAIEVLQQFTPFCDEGEDLREVLSKVNTYSQRAIAKRKKEKTIKDYFKLLFSYMMFFCITYYA